MCSMPLVTGSKIPFQCLSGGERILDLVDADGKVIQKNVPRTADDTIFVHGTLSTGVPVSLTLRGGKPFIGTPGLDWRIQGKTCEIRVTAAGPFLQIGYSDMKIELHTFRKYTMDEVNIPKDELDVEDVGSAFNAHAVRNVANHCHVVDGLVGIVLEYLRVVGPAVGIAWNARVGRSGSVA